MALDQYVSFSSSSPCVNSLIIPEIDLSQPAEAKTLLVQACEELGFFKVVNHGVPMELMNKLDNGACKFFGLSPDEKERVGNRPFGYGERRIGPNGDEGCVEYLLMSGKFDDISKNFLKVFREAPDFFCSTVRNYVLVVKKVACEVLELLADGLGISERDVFSKLLNDGESDSVFRINHYPLCPEFQASGGGNSIGFGEHTDPQIISVLRSNNTAGFQIAMKDGSWFSVPPDQNSFYINVGDSLQVLTNGRFRSVNHRVLGSTLEPRVSMIFFGAPPLNERIAPLPSLLADGEESSKYKEFTWSEYKNSVYKSKLSDNRLVNFEKQQNTRPPPHAVMKL